MGRAEAQAVAAAEIAATADVAEPANLGVEGSVEVSVDVSVEVVYCARAGAVDAVHLKLQRGATLDQALHASGLLDRHALAAATVQAGLWGRVQPPDTVLRDRDRIEIYRPLTVDPKEARRLRYQQHRESLKAAEALKAARVSNRLQP